MSVYSDFALASCTHLYVLQMLHWLPCVLQSSGISWRSAVLIVRYNQKKECISVFYCFENPSIAHNLRTTGPIQVGFSAKYTSANKHFNQIENWKCHIFYFRMISLFHITYYWIWLLIIQLVLLKIIIKSLQFSFMI